MQSSQGFIFVVSVSVYLYMGVGDDRHTTEGSVVFYTVVDT